MNHKLINVTVRQRVKFNAHDDIISNAMHKLYTSNVVESYDRVLKSVMRYGQRVETRGLETVELQNFVVNSYDPSDYIIWDQGDPRREYLWSEIDTVRNGEEPEFQAWDELDTRLDLDDGTFYEDVIRNRVSSDWDEWVELLSNDQGTRKAVSLFGSSPDAPCTSRVQWMIRPESYDDEPQLHCFTYNRSQDMMFAYPMDVGLFGHYHHELAEQLGVTVGRHEHSMTSAHIYVNQLDEAKEITSELE